MWQSSFYVAIKNTEGFAKLYNAYKRVRYLTNGALDKWPFDMTSTQVTKTAFALESSLVLAAVYVPVHSNLDDLPSFSGSSSKRKRGKKSFATERADSTDGANHHTPLTFDNVLSGNAGDTIDTPSPLVSNPQIPNPFPPAPISPSATVPAAKKPRRTQGSHTNNEPIGYVYVDKTKFKCNKPGCKDVTLGRLTDLYRHYKQRSHASTGGRGHNFGTRKDNNNKPIGYVYDDKTFKCSKPDCNAALVSTSNLHRHYEKKHSEECEKYYCSVSDCRPDGFSRKDNRDRHERFFHQGSDYQGMAASAQAARYWVCGK